MATHLILGQVVKGQGHRVTKCKNILKAIEWPAWFCTLSSGQRLVVNSFILRTPVNIFKSMADLEPSIKTHHCMRQETTRSLRAFEMWIWRRMITIPWTQNASNEQILEMVDESRSILLETLRKRQKNWIGHVLNHDSLLKKVIEWKLQGKNKKDGLAIANGTCVSFCNQPKARFGLPWVRPWDNRDKCYMDGKRI